MNIYVLTPRIFPIRNVNLLTGLKTNQKWVIEHPILDIFKSPISYFQNKIN